MAARRLVIVMLVLLGISILVTALLPDTTEVEREDEATEAAPAPTPSPAAGGELVTARIDAGEREPERIDLRVGDQLALTVRSPRADQVAIPALGELEFVGPLAPARFDFLAWEEATYAVRMADADRLIGRIEVGPARSAPGERKRQLTRPSAGKRVAMYE